MATMAFGYLRVSGKSQIDGDGLDRQEAAIRSCAKKNDIKIVKLFKEFGVSGTKDITDRPAFVAMMEALHADGGPARPRGIPRALRS